MKLVTSDSSSLGLFWYVPSLFRDPLSQIGLVTMHLCPYTMSIDKALITKRMTLNESHTLVMLKDRTDDLYKSTVIILYNTTV